MHTYLTEQTDQVLFNPRTRVLTSGGVSWTMPATGTTLGAAPAGTLVITDGKVFTVTGTLTLAGTDESTLNIGAGGTLASGAYAAAMVADTGWIAPQSAGIKTGVSNYTAPVNFEGSDTTDVAALATLGNRVQELIACVQAIQTALVARLLPNA